MFTAVLAGAAAAFLAGPVDTPRLVLAGRSVHGHPISAIRTGDATALRTVLVIGCLHGNECAGTAVVRELRRRSAPAGTQVWTVRSANPDGEARGKRQNAHGVDLKPQFPAPLQASGPAVQHVRLWAARAIRARVARDVQADPTPAA
jgi:murein tripeptide amidase MpaA